jgi:serine/threonine protein phosphatase PrpC
VTIKAYFITNTGKTRGHNEDSIMLDDLIISETSMNVPGCRESGERGLFIVADGMGGHAKGEVASRAVLNEFRERSGEMASHEDILKIIRGAKYKLNEMARADEKALGLGTTVAGILLMGKNATIFNCGDSRVYRLNGPCLERISKDHSMVQELVDIGMLAEEDIRYYPLQNIITSAIIGDLEDDLPSVYIRDIEIRGEQSFLLCTDGLWESMDKKNMEECFSSGEPEAAVNCLFSKTMHTLAKDNVSIIVLEATF